MEPSEAFAHAWAFSLSADMARLQPNETSRKYSQKDILFTPKIDKKLKKEILEYHKQRRMSQHSDEKTLSRFDSMEKSKPICIVANPRQICSESELQESDGDGYTCPAAHLLINFRTPTWTYFCNVCTTRQRKRTNMFGCRVCDWDVCDNCYKEWRKCPLKGLEYQIQELEQNSSECRNLDIICRFDSENGSLRNPLITPFQFDRLCEALTNNTIIKNVVLRDQSVKPYGEMVLSLKKPKRQIRRDYENAWFKLMTAIKKSAVQKLLIIQTPLSDCLVEVLADCVTNNFHLERLSVKQLSIPGIGILTKSLRYNISVVKCAMYDFNGINLGHQFVSSSVLCEYLERNECVKSWRQKFGFQTLPDVARAVENTIIESASPYLFVPQSVVEIILGFLSYKIKHS